MRLNLPTSSPAWAAIAPRRLSPRISGVHVRARGSSKIVSESARLREIRRSPARMATYKVLSGKWPSGHGKVMPWGRGLVGNGMSF